MTGSQSSLASCCELKDCLYIYVGELRKLCQNLVGGRSASKVLEDVVDGDARTADARFARSNCGINGYSTQ